jgi:ATP-dependent Lon protease
MIRKGEGITHALVHQLKSDPKSFGFEGDENNTIELHRWAQQKSYDLAVENDFINPEKGVEVRVVFDKDNPSGYFLHKDGFIEKIKLNNSENFESVSSVAPETEIKHVDDDEYAWSVGKQIKSDLEEAKTREDLAISEFNKADISSEPSSVEDVRKEINEVPKTVLEENEEVENLKEEMPEQAEKIETEKEEIKNIEKNTEVNNLEKESKIENELINSGAKTETINLSKFSKVVFKFNKDNKVSDVLIPTRELDYYSNEDANANLNNNWFDTIRNRKDQYLARESILRRSKVISVYNKILEVLQKDGRGNGPEADFIKKQSKHLISMTEKKYGDVFK